LVFLTLVKFFFFLQSRECGPSVSTMLRPYPDGPAAFPTLPESCFPGLEPSPCAGKAALFFHSPQLFAPGSSSFFGFLSGNSAFRLLKFFFSLGWHDSFSQGADSDHHPTSIPPPSPYSPCPPFMPRKSPRVFLPAKYFYLCFFEPSSLPGLL